MRFTTFLVILVLGVLAVGLLGRFSLEETLRVSADDLGEVQIASLELAENEEVDPLVFSEATQFSVGETRALADTRLTLQSASREPFSVVFASEGGEQVVFSALEETRSVGGVVFKLSQVAPLDYDGGLTRVVLLAGTK